MMTAAYTTRFTVCLSGAVLLFAALQAHGADVPPPPPAPTLDVTMNVVPLNVDIEKTVVHTIVIPGKSPATDLNKQTPAMKHPDATQQKNPPATGIKSVDSSRASVLHDADEARREAAETAKEAQKDRDNSGVDDDEPPSGG